MKSRTLMWITPVILFAVVALPTRMAAQSDPAKIPQHNHYKLIDMGTFGGPASSINSPFSQGTLNNQDIATGWSATSFPTLLTSSFLICGGLDAVVPFITHTFEWNGVVRDLGAFPPSETNCSEPFYMNGKGEIVGASETAEVDPQFFGLQQIHAVLWKDGQMIDLGTLGGNQVAAFGINEHEQIVGVSTNAIPDAFCFFGTVQQRAFLWERGQMRDLGTLGGNCAGVGIVDSNLHPINESGQIVGGSSTSASPNPLTGFPTFDPFLWEYGRGMTDLGTLGGAYGGAQAINNRGQIIGQSSIASDPGACNGFPDNGNLNCHAFLWDRGTLVDLTTTSQGGNPEFLAAINDAGEIIGWGVFPNSSLEAFVWRAGVATDLGHLDGCFSFTQSINSQSQIVGAAISCDGTVLRAFVWEHGSMVDLNTLIPPGSGLQLIDATDINDRGEIVGDGVPPGASANSFADHGFLLIPCDENHPGIEGCDYSLVDGNATATGIAMPTTTTVKPELSPDANRQLMQAAGRRSKPWYRGFGAQPPK
jgi:probable HAF family extracellular repeat protein